jgi:hypothetical protein
LYHCGTINNVGERKEKKPLIIGNYKHIDTILQVITNHKHQILNSKIQNQHGEK